MDYKELIEQLQRLSRTRDALIHTEMSCACADAATAIETLLAEREDSRLTPKMVACPGGWKGMRSTRYYCPRCKKAVRNDEAYCHKCGQAILFPKQEYDKENNKIWLNFEAGEQASPTPPDRERTDR